MYETTNKLKTYRPANGRTEKTQHVIRMLFRSHKLPRLQLIIFCLTITMFCQFALATTQVSQFGITWTFDKDYQVGQFANGDYWILGPVTVTSVSPEPSSGRNGSMINPITGTLQGYDNRIPDYVSSLSVSFPKTLQSGESLVSTESLTGTDCHMDLMGICVSSVHAFLKNAAVLTVLDSVPPVDSFRPPFVGSEKPIYTKSQLQRQILPKLSKVASTPPLSTYERYLQRPWLNHKTDWTGRRMHPTQNMPNYYREAFIIYSTVPLLLSLDFTDQEKEAILIRFVQLGIDQYATILNGAGDKMIGRGPIALTGLLLDDSGMLSYSYGYREVTTYYYDDLDLPEWMDSEGRPVEPGTPGAIKLRGVLGWTGATVLWRNKIANPYEHIHPSEWKSVYTQGVGPEGACKHDTYRFCCFSHTYVGEALAGHIIPSLKEAWNHPPFFDYIDRWMTEDVPWSVRDATCGSSWITSVEKSSGSTFIGEMWNTYRALTYEPDNTPPLPPTNLISTTQTENSISLSWTAPDPASDGDLASSYRIFRDTSLVGWGVESSFQDTGLAAEISYDYKVYSVDDAGNQSTSAATGTFSTLADTTPPSIVSVSASETSVEIVFNERMEQSSAENKDLYKIKYGISSSIQVMAASLGSNLTTVTLTTLSHVEGSYTLTVEAVRDISGNPIVSPASINYEYTIGLASYWRFDGNTDDETGINNGTIIGNPQYVSGVQGQALEFDGDGDRVTVFSDPSLEGFSAMTVSVWFYARANADSGGSRFISKSNGASGDDYGLLMRPGNQPEFALRDKATIKTTTVISLNTWYHLAGTYNGSTMKIYLNGVEENSTAANGAITDNNGVLSFGGHGTTPSTRELDGLLDDARIYNRAINAAEVSELYNCTPPALFNIQATNITPSGATITWNTNENSTSQVEYGLDNSYGNTTPLETTFVTSHSVVLTWLSPSTTYHFRVISADASENESISQDNTFITLGTTTYSITASANSGGTISPIGTTQVYSGGAQTYTITPTTGYHIVDVLMDGSSVGAVISYSFTNVTANHTIAASFAIDTHTITASAGSGGTISPSGTTQVNWSGTQSYTITPNPGYHVSDVLVDSSSVGTATSYSFTNVTANHTIAVTFAENDVTNPIVTNLSPQAGSIQASLNTLVTLSITDSGDGVDADSVTIKVNNDTVYSGNTAKYSSTNGECYRTGTKTDYKFVYQANESFDFDQPISVTVNATNLAGNAMAEYSYSFTTEMRSFGENKKVSSDNLNKSSAVTVRDSNGDIWSAWQAGATGSRDIYISILAAGAANFSNGIKVKNNSTDQCNPAMAVGSDDKLYVAWQDSRRGNWDIYVSTSSDGINWSTETRVTDSNDNQINPAIVVDGSNNAYIVWMDDRNGNQDIYIATSSDGFVTKTVSQITLDNSNQVEPAIAVDPDNTVYVVWTDTRNSKNDIYGAASNNDPWTNIPVVTTEQSQSSPAIATEAVGSILHLVWVDDTPGDDDIFYAKTSGGLPSSPLTGSSIIDDTSSTDQLRPAIAVSGSTGNNLQVFVCWVDERNADEDLYFAELGPGSGTNVFVDDDGTNTDQTEPAINIDGDGHPYLVWTDSRNTNTDIYYAGSTSIESDLLASNNISTSSTVTVGTPLNSINSVDDISIEVPAGSYPFDIKVTISKITNPLAFTLQCLGAYDFGPSSIEFSQPVTIIIPYNFTGSEDLALAYWYNSLTDELSQQGITDVETIEISQTLHALRFKTTHFTPFYILLASTGAAASGGGGGGGGCSMSPDSQASAVELLLPYIGLIVVMVVLKLQDKRKRKARNITKSEC